MVIQLELLGLMEIEVLIGDHNLLKLLLLYRAFLFFEVEIACISLFLSVFYLIFFSIHSSKALIASSWSNTSDGSLRFSGFSSNSS